MYLRIQNEGVSSIDLFLRLGASSSRGDESRIGQFGSGALLGALTLLRSNLPPTVFVGLTRVKYVMGEERTECDPGGNSVTYTPVLAQVSNRKPYDLNIALEYGAMDWDNPLMGVREFISNALDYSSTGISGVKIDLVDNATPRAGKTCVYIPATSEIVDYHATLASRFLQFDPRYKAGLPTLIVKSEPSPPRIYRKGVFVAEIGSKPSLFNYNLREELKIDDCRNLGTYQCQEACTKKVCADDSALRAVFARLPDSTPFFEGGFRTYDLGWEAKYNNDDDKWLECWQAVHGNAVIATADHAMIIPHAIDRGFRVVVISHNSWYEALAAAGVPTVLSSLDNVADNGCELYNAPPALIACRDRVWDWLTLVEMTDGKPAPPVMGFIPILDSAKNLLGFYDRKKEIIGIRNDRLTDPSVMIEELSHYASGEGDLSREFQTFALNLACKLAIVSGG